MGGLSIRPDNVCEPASLAQESIERALPLTSWRVYEGMGLVWVAPQSGKLFTPWDELPEMQASMRFPNHH